MIRGGVSLAALALWVAAGAAMAEGQETLRRTAPASFESWTDADGVPRYRMVNRRYLLAPVARRDLLLEETVTIISNGPGARPEGRVQLAAWAHPSPADAGALLQLDAPGEEGAVEETLYRVTRKGCCTESSVHTWFSLETGRSLFSATAEPARTRSADAGAIRHAAFHANDGVVSPPGGESDPRLCGVLYVGGEREPADRLAFVAGSAVRCSVSTIGLAAGADDPPRRELWLGAGARDFHVVVELDVRREDFVRGRIVVPVVDGTARRDLMQIEPSLGLRPGS